MTRNVRRQSSCRFIWVRFPSNLKNMGDPNGGQTRDWLEGNRVLISEFVALAILDSQQGREYIFLWSVCRGFAADTARCVSVLVPDHMPAAGSNELL